MQWLQPSGLSITSSLRQWRKKDAQQQSQQQQQHQPQQQSSQPQPLTSTTDQTLPQIPPISENGSHVARVAPQAHYSRPSTDAYRFPPQYPEYGLSFKDINSPGKYSEIVDNGPPHLPQDPKEKEYLKMCSSIQQQHLKQYPDPSLKPTYPGATMKQAYDTGIHPQMHPYMQKESPVPSYMQKEMQYTPQCFQKFNMQPPQYGNNYVPESNSFLATLSKINPRMAQSIISDPHIREASMGYHNVDQNHNYAHTQRLYPTQPPMHTSPGYQGGHRNLTSAPQGYSCAQQYGYKPPESYNRLPQYQAPNALGQPSHELPMRQPCRDNIPLPMNYSTVPQKLSQCAQLEYSQHYQHRRYQMLPEYYQQSYKSPYMQNQDLPPVAPAETAVPSARMKQFWESWGEEEVEAIPETVASEPEKRKEDRPTEQLYVLGATEIPRDSLGQYVEIEALPENMRELYENGSIIIKATTTENSVQDVEVVASSSNRINILDHKRILPGSTTAAAAAAAAAEQVVNLHILEAPDQQDEASKPSEPQSEWLVENVAEEKGSPKSMPTISDMFEEEVAPEQMAETEKQSEVCKASVEDASAEKEEEKVAPEATKTTKDSITDSLKTEVEDKTNIPEEEVGSGRSNVVEGCSVIVNRRKTIEEIVQKITFKKNCEEREHDSTFGYSEETQTELKGNCVDEEINEERSKVEEHEKEEIPAEKITAVLEDPKVEDNSSFVEQMQEDDKNEERSAPKNAEGTGTLEETLETEVSDDLKHPLTPIFDKNVTDMEETPKAQDSQELLGIDAFKLENNNVLIHFDGALVEIKVSYEGKKKIITVVPYCGDSDSETSEVEEEVHSRMLSDVIESNDRIGAGEEIAEEELQQDQAEIAVGVEEQVVEVESAKEESSELGNEFQDVSEVEQAELQEVPEMEQLLNDDVEDKTEQVLEDETTTEGALEEESVLKEDHSSTQVEVDEAKCGEMSVSEDETANKDRPEIEEGNFQEIEVDQFLPEVEVEAQPPEEVVMETEVAAEGESNEEVPQDTNETPAILEQSDDEVFLETEIAAEGEAHEDAVQEINETSIIEEQSDEEIFLETEVAAEGETDEKVPQETDGTPLIEEQSDEEIFLETKVVAEGEAIEEAPQEINETSIIEEQSDEETKVVVEGKADEEAPQETHETANDGVGFLQVKPKEATKTEVNEVAESVIENVIFEADVSGEVIIGSPTSGDKIEIEEAAADSTQTSITEVQKPSLLTKASRKHFSDDDMAVKSETQTKLASKKRKELRERRVTIAEDLPRGVKEDEGPPVKKVRFLCGKTRVPMINSSNNEGSMRNQVEEATFQEKLSKKRKTKLEEKSCYAIDLTKNRDGGTKSSKHHQFRPVRPIHTKDLPECEVTTTTKTVEDKIEIPALNDFQTRTDETEVTSSTKVVVNVKSYISRTISEDSSDGGQKKRLTLEEYTNRKKRLNSSASPATEVPSESQDILKQFTQKLLNPPAEKKMIDINEFDIPTRSQELDEIRKSPSYTIENPQTVKSFEQEINLKLKSLDFQLIKQKQKEKNDLLMRRFLNNEKLTEEEMQKVKEIIHCKRMLVEMNKVRMQKLATEHKYERLDPSSNNMKLHLKKIVETKPRKRFRNLYGESSSDSEDAGAVGTAPAPAPINNRDPRINRRLHGETVESDYLAYQTKVKNGVPKIIIRRRLPNVMQPYVKLERSPQIDLLAKRRRVC